MSLPPGGMSGWLLVASIPLLFLSGCGQNKTHRDGASPTGGSTASDGKTGGTTAAGGSSASGTGGAPATGGGAGVGTGGVSSGGSEGKTGGTGVGGTTDATGGTTSGGATGGTGAGGTTDAAGGMSTGGGATGGSAVCSAAGASSREQPAYPDIDETAAGCGDWALVDNVCCAQYCASNPKSENCDECAGTSDCVPVNSKGCISGKWPEQRCVTDDEPWHYSRSTHYGLTNGGACAFGYYGLCTTSDKFTYTDPVQAAKCDAFCKAYPDLCADPEAITLRGNFAAPQGNYYSQFWPSLPGDRDNYLSCGECFEILRTKPDGSEYQPGEAGYTRSVILQITDSCPCSANSKWCCGSGRDHCAEVKSDTLDFAYGCPLPPGDLEADHDPQPDESIHLDLSDIAMSRLQSGDPNLGMVDGVIATKYRRVPCPVVGNIYVWLLTGASEYYFALSAVNAGGPGSIVGIDAKLASGEWSAMKRDSNYTSARPQERYGTWVVPPGAGPFALPMALRFTSPSGEVVEAPEAIQSWTPTDPSQDVEMYYVDTGVQFSW
jgi:hypothetical protein